MRETNLFVKVGIKYNQVEITLQALNCSTEEVIFGTASLQNIDLKKDLEQPVVFCFCIQNQT